MRRILGVLAAVAMTMTLSASGCGASNSGNPCPKGEVYTYSNVTHTMQCT